VCVLSEQVRGMGRERLGCHIRLLLSAADISSASTLERVVTFRRKTRDAQRPVRLALTSEHLTWPPVHYDRIKKRIPSLQTVCVAHYSPRSTHHSWAKSTQPRVVTYLTGRQGARILTTGPCTAGAGTQSRVQNLDRRRQPAPRSCCSEMCQAHIHYDQWSCQPTSI